MRYLVASIALCIVGVTFAAGVLSYVNREDAKTNTTLVRFVCAAVEVAREAGTAEATARADRFEAILRDLGESCEGR
jgi:hypothetical protein